MEHSKRSREQPKVTQHICAGARIALHSTLTFLILNSSGDWSLLVSQELTSLFGKVPSALPECLSHTQPHPVIETVNGEALPVLEVQPPGLFKLLLVPHPTQTQSPEAAREMRIQRTSSMDPSLSSLRSFHREVLGWR